MIFICNFKQLTKEMQLGVRDGRKWLVILSYLFDFEEEGDG